ncbi:MAG: phosphotransferase [Alphaproteobacteria bacterium]|nr:phosphotransferase [Alphaproteobacteria bacterium]
MPFRDWLGQCQPEQAEHLTLQLARLSHASPADPCPATGLAVDAEGRVLFGPAGGAAAPKALIDFVLETAAREADTPSARFFHAMLHGNRELFGYWPEETFPPATRPWPILSRACRQRLERAIGTKATFRPLQSGAVRRQAVLRCLKGTGWSLMPFPWRVDCADGRQFKLLKAAPQNRLRLTGVAETAETLRGLPFVPAVLHRDPDYLLLEYKACKSADYQTPAFAPAFGKCLARLHSHEPGFLTREQIARMADGYLLEIERYRPALRDLLARARARLLETAPDQAPTGIVYADLKPDNFLMDERGEMFLPDKGSYQRCQLLDVFLVGSTLFDKLERSAFRKAYLANGGSEVLFSDTRYLHIWNAIKMAAFFLRIHARFSRANRNKQRAYPRWSDDKIGQLREWTETP